LPPCGAYPSLFGAIAALAVLWMAFFVVLMGVVLYVFRFVPLVGRMGRHKNKHLN
jgi:hypothetical protein